MERVSTSVVWLILLLHPLSGVLPNDEVDALSAFKTAIVAENGDPGSFLDGWNARLHHCAWFHVTCNRDNHVTRVDLDGAGLSGPLVPDLGKLTELRYLELYDNNFHGPIPQELGNLINLISLDLYNNNLTGPIPHTLGNLANLQFLRIQNNKFNGCAPIEDLAKTHTSKMIIYPNPDLCDPFKPCRLMCPKNDTKTPCPSPCAGVDVSHCTVPCS